MSDSKTILVADDDAGLRDLASAILTDAGYRVRTASDGTEAIRLIEQGGFDAVVSDVRMPGADGLAVVRAAAGRSGAPPVVLLTAFATIEGAVEAMRAGAFDYLTKPLDSPAALRAVVAQALAAEPGERRASRPQGGLKGAGEGFVYHDPRSQELARVLDLVAARDTTVLLIGESGVGKEVAARRIHQSSRRASGPFVAVNCGAIPSELFESQLFGHVRGAFTGAHQNRQGVFEAADGGTLLLDEVGELPPDSQVKLLRALEERRITRVGESTERPVDVRVIAATLRDLPVDVREGRFREDLYYRLSVFPITVPPLRERPGDILPLAQAALERLGESHLELSPEARRLLEAHPWPGNARELRNVMERASILAGGGVIRPEHVRLTGSAAAPTPSDDVVSLKDLERQAILDALEATGGNRREAAERLGIALRTLQYKLKEYGVTTR